MNALPTIMLATEQDSIVCEIFIAAPPDRVFRALIDRDLALRWGGSPEFEMIEWQMDARPGGKWSLAAKERNPSGEHCLSEFRHYGEILQFDPPRLLVYTWFANWHADPGHQTVVSWNLTAVPGGTKVKVTHSGLAPLPDARQGYSQGWPGLLARVKQVLEENS